MSGAFGQSVNIILEELLVDTLSMAGEQLIQETPISNLGARCFLQCWVSNRVERNQLLPCCCGNMEHFFMDFNIAYEFELIGLLHQSRCGVSW